MKSNINKKIEEIFDDFKSQIIRATEIKDKQISDLFESAENEYVEKIKNDIKI